jgi:hypothetical protein
VAVGDLMFEIDVFTGAHEGLVLAEIELPHGKASFERPDWLGDEVTGDLRHYDANLAASPGAGQNAIDGLIRFQPPGRHPKDRRHQHQGPVIVSADNASTSPASAAGSSSDSTARSPPRAAPSLSAAFMSMPIT